MEQIELIIDGALLLHHTRKLDPDLRPNHTPGPRWGSEPILACRRSPRLRRHLGFRQSPERCFIPGPDSNLRLSPDPAADRALTPVTESESCPALTRDPGFILSLSSGLRWSL